MNSIEVTYTSQVIIGDSKMQLQRVVDKIIFPDSLRREVYVNDTLDNLTISVPGESFFIKFNKLGESISFNRNQEQTIQLYPIDYIDKSLNFESSDTLIDGRIYKYFSSISTLDGYIMDVESKIIRSIVVPDQYGKMTISFADYRAIGNHGLLPFRIHQRIPSVGYTREIVYEFMEPKSSIAKEEFILKEEWISWSIGADIPAFELPLLDSGGIFSNKNLSGKVTLIDFWATWCKPCISEFPQLKMQYQKYHDKGFEILGISLDDDRSRLDNYLNKNNLPWLITHQNGGFQSDIALKFKVATLPKPILIDGDGKILALDADVRGDRLEKRLMEIFGDN